MNHGLIFYVNSIGYRQIQYINYGQTLVKQSDNDGFTRNETDQQHPRYGKLTKSLKSHKI